MKKDNPSFEHEEKRLSETINYMRMTLKATDLYRSGYKANLKEAMLNAEDMDSSQSYINILVNTQFMAMAERNYDSLNRSLSKPYFARIDFKAKGTERVEALYLGKTSLMRDDLDTPLIVDWRAPIANLYYEGRLGHVTYASQGDLYEGEMLLKRQYDIEQGSLKNYMDIDVATNDALLQASLEAGADNRLKDIATTIQAEQNRVIRADMRKPLIVQGVAGSGKTTIALHRIAYFIYTYQDVIRPDQYMIIAPNHLFLNYISEVLPELGVEKVLQTTFEDFFKKVTGLKFKSEANAQKLVDHFKHTYGKTEENLILQVSKFKGQMLYKELIDAYITDYLETFIPETAFKFEDKMLMGLSELNQLMREDWKHLPIYARVTALKQVLNKRTKLFKEELIKQIKAKYDALIDKLCIKMPQGEERRTLVIDLMDRRDKRLEEVKRLLATLVKDYLEPFKTIKLLDHYALFLKGLNANELVLKALKNHTLIQIANKKIESEDYAALLYLQHQFYGPKTEIDIKSIVVDEAQDFSPFQMYALKAVCRTDMITLLGDVSQGIHSYRSIDSWQELIGPVFKEDHVTYLTLEQSYRTTIEIMAYANRCLRHWDNPHVIMAKPVIRHGESPKTLAFDGEKKLVSALETEIEGLFQKGHQSIAVICKTEDECQQLMKTLKNHHPVCLTGDETEYHAGLVLLPAYVAKGLEFDVTLIVSITEQYSLDPLDIKLLYVASTRAMHHMAYFFLESLAPCPLKPLKKTNGQVGEAVN